MLTQASRGSLVLLYHRMGSAFVRSIVRGQYVFPTVFRWQLTTLLAGGYTPCTLAEIAGDAGKVAGHFNITFDDGFTSVHRLAAPLLAELKLPCTVFVVTGGIGGTNVWDQRDGDRAETIMTVAEMRELAAAGIEIGSHTMNHPHLTRLSADELRHEIADSKAKLEDLLGKPVPAFSYPYGEWDPRVRDAVVAAGYQYATATTLYPVTPALDPFAIPRVNMRWNTFGPLLRRKVRRAYRKLDQAHAVTTP